ncbi:MAG: bis(5'-nucleosyl)-tetraphosphatase (symmetrical) [Gammaproteobacteria bacterium]|jgi:bis(5'-nucleosyl)-tetraphosphatase (symmetrical)
MATYAIGDIQGCFDEFVDLLDAINFERNRDTLWLVGDLVNRGPKSLAVLEYVYALGDSAVTVLGNHDLHLLACAFIDKYKPSSKDTFQDVLRAPNCNFLLTWLRHKPLVHRDTDLGFTMVHAGIPPDWSPATACDYAAEVEAVLRGHQYKIFFANMYGNVPDLWSDDLTDWPRIRLVTNLFTRLRYYHPDRRMDFKHKGPLGSQPDELTPWYELYQFSDNAESIVFGHWSALHLDEQAMQAMRIYPLDTGAVWGGRLTALRLEDRQFFSVPSKTCLPIAD